MASELMGRYILATIAGMQFGGDRDLYEVLGYKRALTYADFNAKYERQDIASRIVDAPATATWRKPPTLESDSAEFLRAWEQLVKRHKIWHVMERADRLSGIGRYGIIFIGTRGNGNKASPINQVSSPDGIIYLSVFGEGRAEITDYENDTSNPRFGLPKTYSVSSDNQTSTRLLDALNRIHHSRVIHIAENTLDNDVFGRPRLQSCFNLLDDLEKVAGGSAEMFWLNARQGMQVDINKDTELHEDDAKKLEDEIEDFQHQLRRFIRTRGVQVNDLGGEVHDPKGTFDILIALISGATGIPKRILLGSEQGELASTQDRANWSEKIQERRNVHAEPNILRPFIDRMQFVNALPEAEYNVQWPDLLASSLDEKSMIARRFAQAIKALFEVYQEAPLTLEEVRKHYFELQPETTEVRSRNGRDAEDT